MSDHKLARFIGGYVAAFLSLVLVVGLGTGWHNIVPAAAVLAVVFVGMAAVAISYGKHTE